MIVDMRVENGVRKMRSATSTPPTVKQSPESGLFVVNLEDINSRTFILFVQTAELVLKYSDAALYRAGLSLIKLMVLQVLVSHGGSLTPSRIADLTVREKHNITTLIRRLQRDGFIRVSRNTKDRRSFNVVITDKGRKAIKTAVPTAKKIVKEVMSTLPSTSTLAFEALLKEVRQNAWEALVKLGEDEE